MRKNIQKLALILGIAAILNSGLNLSPTDGIVQAEDTKEEWLQSYQSIGNVKATDENSVFIQEAGNGGLVFWNWEPNEQKTYLIGTRNYWNNQGNLKTSELKINLSKYSTKYFKFVLSFMKESEEGDIYLFLEKKNKKKAMYIKAGSDGTIKQGSTIDLKILGNNYQYTLDDMKLVSKNKIGILYSDVSDKEETKKKVLSVNIKKGTASNEQTEIEWNKNKGGFLESSFIWEEDFVYSLQGSKILIVDSEKQDKKIIEIPKEFQNFSVCMTGNTVFLFDIEKGVYYYNLESSYQLEQMDTVVPNIDGNYKVAAVTVTKEKDTMYISLSNETSAGEESAKSYQILKYQLGQTEKEVRSILADYKEYSSAQELVADADWIFSGTVKNIIYEQVDIGTTEESDLMPYTIFEIEVSEVYKGDIKDQTVYIKRLGGISGMTICEVGGALKIEYGNRYLFVAQTFENSYPSLLNLNQCTFNLDTETEDTEHRGITYSQILKAVG